MRTANSEATAADVRQEQDFWHSKTIRNLYLAVALLLPALIAIGCWLDGTWAMAGDNKGFSQYYGFWVIFVTTPVIFLLTSQLVGSFIGYFEDPEAYCGNLTNESKRRVQTLVTRHIRSLEGRSRSFWILMFVLLVFLFWWTFNVVNTWAPTKPFETFGHDVFDTSAHPFGFYTTKVYLFFVFVLVYGPAAYVALHVTASMISILKLLSTRGLLQVDVFHADNCGGTSRFGNLNLVILCIYVNLFAVIYAMYVTHGHAYFVMAVSLIACSALAVAQSIGPVYYVHRVVAARKREYITAVGVQLNQQLSTSLQPGGKFANDLLAFRSHLGSMHTFPYGPSALVAVNVIRVAPVVLGVLNYIRQK